MRIMTTNIWGSYFNNPAEVRKDDMYKVYETYAPDIIGFQEVEPQWYACDMFRRLSDDYYIVGAQPFDSFNFVPMAIRKKYKVMAFGFERLTDVKDPSKEITWAVLQEDERLFAVLSHNAEGFDVGSVSPYIRDDSDERYQRFFIHSNLHFAARRHK